MSGYTPVFSEIYLGSLYGQWPAAAVWASLLPLCDQHGHIDIHPSAIAGMTGWPLDLLMEGIKQLSEPDEHSRTPDDDGRRLVPLEEGRAWGWKVVNHAKYREKARLTAKNAREVAEGKNRDRMAGRTAADRRSPPDTAADPLSNSNTNKDKNIVGSADQHRVFDHWKTVHNHPTAKLDGKRSRLITAALKNYTADQLCACIYGYKLSEFHQGKNKDGKVYDSLSLMLRDAEHIDAGIKMAQGGQQKWL